VIWLPRKPTTEVIEHRITFGQKERNLLDTVVTSYGFNRVSSPLIALLSDVSAMAFLTTIYVGYKYGPSKVQWLKNRYESLEELAQDVQGILESEYVETAANIDQTLQNIEESGQTPLQVLFSGTPLGPLFSLL